MFTPTFNRAHTLSRVYESLISQVFQDFEWIIVDDGSQDETAKLVENWKKLSSFKIVYHYQENAGKHVAINKGLKLSSADFFLIADSDDSFFPYALQHLSDTWDNISHDKRRYFTGVTGLCIYDNGTIVGSEYPTSPFDSTPADTFFKYNIKGEKWGFHRVEVLREFPFPEVKGVNFYPEGLIWNKIGKKYLTRYINVPLRTYHSDSGNQLSSSSPFVNSKMRIYYAKALNDDSEYLAIAPFKMLKIAAQGSRFSFHQKDSLSTQFSRLKKYQTKVLWCFGLPVGLALFFWDRFKCNE